MKLEYIGHACFRLTAADGTRVITDPYDASVGIAMLPLEAELVTISHGHHDHCCEDMLRGAPRIVRGTQEARVGSVTTRAFASWHDDARGAKRGESCVRLFEIDGLRIVHMGDQGCMPAPDVLAAIDRADVMLMPVGGFYAVDARGAKAICEAAHARCVVPMHYLTAHGAYSVIGDHRAFLSQMGAQDAQPVDALTLAPGSVPEGVVLMQPQADALR